jgi:hypothetical protein
MTTFDPAQPVYRYYVADLMTVLAEIPFTGVTYDRALKGAGTFSGQVAVLDDTVAANLYDYTVPGKTSLYIVRNNVCVWG